MGIPGCPGSECMHCSLFPGGVLGVKPQYPHILPLAPWIRNNPPRCAQKSPSCPLPLFSPRCSKGAHTHAHSHNPSDISVQGRRIGPSVSGVGRGWALIGCGFWPFNRLVTLISYYKGFYNQFMRNDFVFFWVGIWDCLGLVSFPLGTLRRRK